MARKIDPLTRFSDVYGRGTTDAGLIVEREAIGGNVGANGYATVRQAEMLARTLGLRGSKLLLDVGAGRGWPGLYLARKTGCGVVLADMPASAAKEAMSRAGSGALARRITFVRASGAQLPFRPRSFDAVSHTDTL